MKKEVDEGLQAALRNLGYVRVKKNLYKAPWSSETVCHFIGPRWFQKFGSLEEVEVNIGLRHHAAQAFAAALWYDFGNPYTRDFWKGGPTESLVGFSLGNLCSWSVM